jgi:F-type H+-transporting ATPase subunit b
MQLVTPAIGLIFWTALTFLIVLFLLSRFAWKPILSALSEREKNIADALSAAEAAKQEMAKLKSQNEALLQEARQERDKILREAKTASDRLISEATEKATAESNKIIASAQEVIQNEKMAALAEVKNQVAALSLSITEKLLKKELSDKDAQLALIKNFMNETKVN